MGRKMKALYNGTVKNGKFIPDKPKDFRFEFYRREGKRVSLTVSYEKKNRSNNQNKYYWGVVCELISEVTGYEKDEIHEILKQMFLAEPKFIGSQEVVIGKSSADLDTVQYEDYLEKIRRWAVQELNCYIPLPNEGV